MGIYKETNIPRWLGILILMAVFLVIFQPWQLGWRELFRVEGLYAALATEFDPGAMMVTAHGMPIRESYPVYPALVRMLAVGAGLPMEFALRLVSMVMLAAGAAVVCVAAGSERSPRAGIVAAAMYMGTFLVLEKGVEGSSIPVGALILLSAQLLFFQYGIRKANWSAAWIFSLGLMAVGFLTDGFVLLLYFIFPLLFLRRPLSVKSKFKKPGFIVGCFLLGGTILAWNLPGYGLPQHNPLHYYDIYNLSFTDYLLELLLFPIMGILRFLPWSFILWIPFCVALQALDTTPIFSRYLRTLTFSTLALLWLLPESQTGELLFLAGPLAIQVGITYDLGMRRYGYKVRKALILAEYFVLMLAAAIGLLWLLPYEWLRFFFSLGNSIDFSKSAEHRIWGGVAAALLLGIALFLHRGRKTRPVWLLLLLTAAAAGIFHGVVLLPYKAQDEAKRQFGGTLQSALAAEQIPLLYKGNILDLYGELHYVGLPVQKIASLAELPKGEKVVYLIDTEFPQLPERNWVNLLPNNFSYRGHRIAVWKGELRSAAGKGGNRP